MAQLPVAIAFSLAGGVALLLRRRGRRKRDDAIRESAEEVAEAGEGGEGEGGEGEYGDPAEDDEELAEGDAGDEAEMGEEGDAGEAAEAAAGLKLLREEFEAALFDGKEFDIDWDEFPYHIRYGVRADKYPCHMSAHCSMSPFNQCHNPFPPLPHPSLHPARIAATMPSIMCFSFFLACHCQIHVFHPCFLPSRFPSPSFPLLPPKPPTHTPFFSFSQQPRQGAAPPGILLRASHHHAPSLASHPSPPQPTRSLPSRSNHAKEHLLASFFVHLKRTRLAKFVACFPNLSNWILLSGPHGSEVYQDTLVRAVARKLNARLIAVDADKFLSPADMSSVPKRRPAADKPRDSLDSTGLSDSLDSPLVRSLPLPAPPSPPRTLPTIPLPASPPPFLAHSPLRPTSLNLPLLSSPFLSAPLPSFPLSCSV
ncbi:unnamed protein product [Closterium sp. NIES-54]